MSDPFMQQAIQLAVENVRSGRGGPFAALIVRDEEVVAEGTNRVTTTNDPTAHAEVVAIRAACTASGAYHLAGCHLYTTCEPCPMCMGAVYWARLERVVYGSTRADAARAGFDDDHIYEELARPPADRKIVMQNVMREEAADAFEAWRCYGDRVPY